jgi:tyrosine-specific transport protein
VKKSKVKFLRAVGMMIGAIVGVGVFGLPYAFSQSGFGIGLLELVLIGIVLTVMQFMLAELVLQSKKNHRLVGHVKEQLGTAWSWVTLVAMLFGIWGAMIAYMIIGGRFLHILLNPVFGGAEIVYSFIVAGIGSLLIYKGLRFASKIEIVIVLALLFLFLFIIAASVPHIQAENFFSMDLSKAFLPYGVILFSMAGIGIVPEMEDVLGRKHRNKLGMAILAGMAVIGLLYASFSFVVVGVTGAATTPAAFDGLIPVLGPTFGIIATFLGSLTILSIYMVLGIEMLNTFRFDFKMKYFQAWLLVVSVPVILFLVGVREFIGIIGFVGSVFGGMLGIMIALSYWKLKKSPWCKTHHCLNLPIPLVWLVALLFFGGMIYQVYTTIVG